MTKQPHADLPALVPLTETVRAGLLPDSQPLTRLPFRVGRDLRGPRRRRFPWFRERRRGAEGPNDLYLTESAPPHRISRQHFLIGFDSVARRFFVEDRSSHCGTRVGEEHLGGDRTGGRRLLQHGDVIRPGGEHSPFAFRFVVPTSPGGSNGDGASAPSGAGRRDPD